MTSDLKCHLCSWKPQELCKPNHSFSVHSEKYCFIKDKHINNIFFFYSGIFMISWNSWYKSNEIQLKTKRAISICTQKEVKTGSLPFLHYSAEVIFAFSLFRWKLYRERSIAICFLLKNSNHFNLPLGWGGILWGKMEYVSLGVGWGGEICICIWCQNRMSSL